ncbi:MAG: peptidoglycan DD-metalloendopeptidase family protein [Myxococcota bacterium]
MSSILVALTLVAADGSVLEGLEELDRRLRNSESALETARAERELARIEASRREGELAAARLRYEEVLDHYRKRVRALARMPQGARLILLGESQSLRAYLKTARLLRRVTRADRAIAQERETRERELRRLEEVAAVREREIARLEVDLQAERDRLAKLRSEKLELVEALARDSSVAERVRREAGKALSALGSFIHKLKPAGTLRRSFRDNRGRLPWPTTGPITARFGQELEREFGTVVKHGGLDFAARAGTRVQTVAPGSVVFADWMRGFGQLVIVDHGQSYHSLYAHLGNVNVQVGDRLDMRDPIGTVGDTGSLRGTLLYFEIRQNGLGVDPGEWLRPE